MTNGLIDIFIVLLLILLIAEWDKKIAGWFTLVIGLMLFMRASPAMNGVINNASG